MSSIKDQVERTETSVDVGTRAAARAESRMLIDGHLVDAASGATFDNVSPATGLLLGATAAADADDMSRAIAAARRAFDETDWPTNGELRKRCLAQLQSAIEAEKEDLREELIAEVGCPGDDDAVRTAGLAAGRIAALPGGPDRRLRMGAHARRRRAVRRAQRAHRRQGTGRRRRSDHPVQLPDRGHPQQARTCAGGRQYGAAEARPEHTVERDPAGQARRRAHRHSGGRAERGHDPVERRRCDPGHRPPRRHDLVHRIHRGRQAADASGRRHDEADVPRTRGQVRGHRARRRQPRSDPGSRDRRVRARRPGMRGHHPHARAPVAVRRGRRHRHRRVPGRAGRRSGSAGNPCRTGDQRRAEGPGTRRR